MPQIARELSHTAITKRLLGKPGLHAVGGVPGLHLQVTSSRAASWILRVTVAGKRKDIGLGGFSAVSLRAARENARRIHEQVRAGIDPLAAKLEYQAAIAEAAAKRLTFEEAAKRCHQAKSGEFRNAKFRNDWLSSIARYATPTLGRLDVSTISAHQVLGVLEPIWQTKTETASRLRGRLEAVFAWATAAGHRTGDNPARWKGNLDHLLPAPKKLTKHKRRHHPALPWKQLPEFMADLRARQTSGAKALEFAILTAARSIEVRGATWGEMDLEAKVWSVPAERMKGGLAHIVPLPDAAVALLASLPSGASGDSVFPGTKGQPLSDMTLSKLMKDMHKANLKAGGSGYVDPKLGNRIATPHGTARSSFKDWCRETLGTKYQDEVSELALAHVNSDQTRAAYARGELIEQRRQLMQDWAQFVTKGARRH